MYLTKNKIGGWLMASLFVGLCSCSDDDTVTATEPLFTVTSVPTLIFPAEETQIENFTFTVDHSWQILCDASWLTFSEKKGRGGQNINVTIEAEDNPTYEQRATTFILVSGERMREFSITQAANVPLGITISNADLLTAENLGKSGGSFTVEFTTKKVDGWDVDFSYDNLSSGWLSVAQKKDNAVEINYAANDVPVNRVGTVRLKSSDGAYTATLDLTQDANPVITLDGSRSLEDILDGYGIKETIASIELSGPLTDADWALLKKLAGSTLKDINLAAITNTVIPNSAFIDCSALTTLVLPTHGQLEYIPMELCRRDANLKSIVIPEGVKYIDRHAFAVCTGLMEVYLPSTIEYLYGYCFEGLGSATTAFHLKTKPLQVLETMRGTDTKSTRASVFNGQGTKISIFVPEEYKAMYENINNFTWEDLGIDESWPYYTWEWDMKIGNFKWTYVELYTE